MHRLFWVISNLLLWFVNINVFADINYYIEHINDVVHVKGEFSDFKAQEEVKLYIPAKIFGTDYSQQIKNLNIINANYYPAEQKVILNNNSNLIIEYDIQALAEKKFLEGFGNNNYHYIDNEKFYLMGEGLFIYPKNYADNHKVIIHLKTQVKQTCYNIKPYLFKDKIVTNFVKLNDLVILGNKNLYENDPIENTKLIVWSDDKNVGDRINTVTGKILKEQKEFW